MAAICLVKSFMCLLLCYARNAVRIARDLPANLNVAINHVRRNACDVGSNPKPTPLGMWITPALFGQQMFVGHVAGKLLEGDRVLANYLIFYAGIRL
jgi:hypothetical protein